MKVKVAAAIKLKMEPDNKNVSKPSRGYTLEVIFELIVLRYGWLIKRQKDLVFTYLILNMLCLYCV